MTSQSVFNMIHQVLAEEDQRLQEKTASTPKTAKVESDKTKEASDETEYEYIKIAEQCDLFSDNLHLLEDERSIEEKLAEYEAIREVLGKHAEEIVVEEAPGGENPIDTKALGEAKGSSKIPDKVEANKKSRPTDSPSGLETNEDKRPGGEKQASTGDEKADEILSKFAEKGYIKKAEDAINPTKISASTKPDFHSVPGVKPQLPQGSKAGEMVPIESLEENSERAILESNEAVINMKKVDGTKKKKQELGEVLSEPAQISSTDPVLQKSLNNTASAGVKISADKDNIDAARELIKKASSSSPEAKEQIDSMIKAAIAGKEIPIPGQELSGVTSALSAPPVVSDNALAAAAQGVTTDELAIAQKVVATQASNNAAASVPAEQVQN